MKRLYLVRHSPAGWLETEPRYRGWSDAGLSGRGREEAKRLAKEFAGVRGTSAVFAVYTSDLERAVETAQGIASATGGGEPKIREGLREISFGGWEGCSHEELVSGGSEVYRAWLKDPLQVAPPGGEGFGEFVGRVRDAIDGIVRDEPEEAEIVLVGHGGSLRVILCGLLGMPDENHWRLRLDHSSVSIVEWSGDLPVLCSMNDLSHLANGNENENEGRNIS
ncbi:MAG: histidine phosphatase family protein [Rubrobacter sp.]